MITTLSFKIIVICFDATITLQNNDQHKNAQRTTFNHLCKKERSNFKRLWRFTGRQPEMKWTTSESIITFQTTNGKRCKLSKTCMAYQIYFLFSNFNERRGHECKNHK